MSYVSSKNMGDDDKDLDWTIFDTYYQGFWYLNLNPFKVGLGGGGVKLESGNFTAKVYFCAFSLSLSLSHKHNVNEIFDAN